MNRRLQILWVVILFSSYAFGQNQANIWHFGLGAGLDFNSTPPTAINNSAISAQEGSAVMCTNGGQLLFYTNGVTVWDRTNNPMPNGTGLFGDASTTQSSVIVHRPGYKNRYYIFTLAALGNPTGLSYSEVNMDLNGGKGDITSTKNTSLQSTLTEKLCAIRHSNGTDYWVLVHGHNNKKFHAFKVTSNGPDHSPVTSDVGSLHPTFGGTLGYMKFSPDGSKVACAVGQAGDFVEVFDFNNTTGELSNPMRIDFISASPYGIEFSPDSKRLYVSAGNTIYQYTIPEISNSTLLAITEKTILADATVWGLQLGPDRKLYVCKQGPKLGVINNPNNDANMAGFIDNVVSLNGRFALQGFPNAMAHLFAQSLIQSENTCALQPTKFEVLLNNLDSVSWKISLLNSTVLHTQTGFKPIYTFAAPGFYNITATVHKENFSENIIKTIKVEGLPQYTLGNDTTLCKGQNLKFDLNITDATYKWSNGQTGSKYFISTPGVHFVDVTVKGCTVRDSILIGYDLIKADFSVNADEQCFDNNEFKYTSKAIDAKTALWYVDKVLSGQGKQGITAFGVEGLHTITHTVTSAKGCSDSVIKEVKVNTSPKAALAITAINNCGSGNKFRFENTTSYNGKYTFEITAENRQYRNISPLEIGFSAPGDYTVALKVKTDDGCEDIVEKKLTVFTAPNAIFEVNATDVCDHNNNFSVNFPSALQTYETLSWEVDGIAYTPATVTAFQHSFKNAGKHNFTAILSNTSGCIANYTREVEVFETPQADFETANGQTQCLGVAPIQFNNTSKTNRTLDNYWWTFSDGTTDFTENPSKQFSAQGLYDVTLKVSNDKGCTSTATKTINTYEKPAVQVNVKTISGCLNDNAFELSYTNNNTSAAISNIIWETPAGTTALPQNPTKFSHTAAGTYDIKLKVETANGCTDEAKTTLTISPNPTGTLVADVKEQCQNQNIFKLTAPATHNGINNTQFVWDFDMGNGTENQNQASVSYKQNGSHNVKVLVTDENGCSAEFSTQVTVHPLPTFKIETTKGCVDNPISITVSYTNNAATITRWDWDLGDGSYSQVSQPQHLYKKAGTYSLSATATTDNGCLYTHTLPYGVEISPIPVINFDYEKISWGFEETVIEFKGSSSVSADNWTWNFGNGQTSANKQEKITYKEAGYYNVSLTSTSTKGCVGSVQKRVLIVPPFDAYVPTSFSPNGDGVNDVFGMEGVEFIKDFKMQVFNRWGQVIFVSSDLKIKWDGKSNGIHMPIDIYSYKIMVTDIDNREYELGGTVQLLR